MNIEMSGLQGWLLAGLITVLITVVGYFGKRLLNSVDKLIRFMYLQQGENKVNEDQHGFLFKQMQAHADKIEDHGERIINLEVYK